MAFQDRNSRRSSRPLGVRPSLEGLEDRLLLFATSGNAWANPSRITYSFVPDGTSVGGTPTNMYAAVSSLGYTAAQYQTQVEKAAAVWQAVANINLALVPDDGSAIGITGNQQGDSRFGDIRIGGYAQAISSQLAFAFLPPPAEGGTAAGDIFFNSSQYWQVNGSNYDIETVAIHEFGHALGMSHSAITQAVMYSYYTGNKQALNADDISGFQPIYGARSTAVPSNNGFATAIDLTSGLNSSGQLTLSNLAVNVPNTDVKWYYVTAPASTSGSLTVTMQSSNLSSLCPQLVIYNQAHSKILANVSAPGSYGATITAKVPVAAAGTGFYIRVQAAQNDPGGTGAFALQVNFSSTPMAAYVPPVVVVAEQSSTGGGTAADTISPTGQDSDAEPTVTIGTLSGHADALTVAPRIQKRVERLAAVREALAHARHETGPGMKGHAAIVGRWLARGRHRG